MILCYLQENTEYTKSQDECQFEMLNHSETKSEQPKKVMTNPKTNQSTKKQSAEKQFPIDADDVSD